MTRITLEVPSEVIGAFTERLTEMELENSIVGTNENNEIEIEIIYEKHDAPQVHELEDYLTELKEGIENEEEEEEDDEK